ncbi:MAG: YdiU family protein [Acidimicrobiales bacterium]
MAVTAPPLFDFDDTFVRDLEGLYEPWKPSAVPEPELVVLNEDLAVELGVDPQRLAAPEGLAVLAGNAVPEGARPVAQAYAGHQFGNYSPRLGDGRALLLGEVIDVHGRRRDLHMKGSGRTPFARGGDGRAALGPMLREYVIGEAMYALGIPTTRGLSVIATGEKVRRETALPGAVLTRAAASHLRVGTFQYAAATGDGDLLRRLADHAIDRHQPDVVGAPEPYLALLDGVAEAQAALVARWMLVGFIHGVMNTDNTTISGETIDYGPCAFMDAYDPATVFSSIDHAGRYAYGNQPHIAQWNLARLAEALLPLIDDDTDVAVEKATEVLGAYSDRYLAHWGEGMRAKLGMDGSVDGDDALIADGLTLLSENAVDFTSFFRALAASLRGDESRLVALFDDVAALDPWLGRWRGRVEAGGTDAAAIAAGMDRVNPVYIARNHLVEEALAAGSTGDLAPMERLLEVLAEPFDERPGLESFALPAPPDFGPYVTFCGT